MRPQPTTATGSGGGDDGAGCSLMRLETIRHSVECRQRTSRGSASCHEGRRPHTMHASTDPRRSIHPHRPPSDTMIHRPRTAAFVFVALAAFAWPAAAETIKVATYNIEHWH